VKEILAQLGARLEGVTHALRLTRAALVLARRRYTAKAKKARRLEEEAEELWRKARAARKEGHPALADRLGDQATAIEALALKAHAGKRKQIGKVKRLTQKKLGLAATKEELEAEIKRVKAAMAAKQKPTVSGNKVTGGKNAEARLQVALLTAARKCADGTRDNFYSQTGDYDVFHCLTGPQRGHRDDCSSFGTSAYWSAGCPDPNRANWGSGYTGTLVAHGRPVSRDYARNHAGVAVIFGDGPGHHVEWSIGDGTEHTIGHGSSPVDMGTFDLLPGTVRFFAFNLN
jgi:hypothetical protein